MQPDRILFLDGEAIVIDKPAGLAVDPPRDGGLSMQNHMNSLTFGFRRWPTTVHRLDRDTSGCLLLARNPKAAKRFGQSFEAGEVEKTYLAVLEGEPAEDTGEIDLALGKVSTREDGWRIVADPKGKPSRTRWEVVARQDGRSLVRFLPATGRTHQLRVHAASGLGAPIVGDPMYGRAIAGQTGGPMLLHAATIRMPRGDKAPVEATAPVPASFGVWAEWVASDAD